MCTKTRLTLIQCEVHDTPPEFKQLFARVPVLSVLPDRIVHRLFGEAVFQLKREHRQPVNEQPYVQRPLRLVPAVAKLPRDGKAVLLEQLLCLRVAGRRGAVEQIQVERLVLDPVAKRVDGAALADFALKPGQKRTSHRTFFGKRQRLGGFGLGVAQECRQLHQIDAVLTVVVVGIAATPPDTTITGSGFCHCARRGGIARIA